MYTFIIDNAHYIKKISNVFKDVLKVEYVSLDGENSVKYFDNGKEIEFDYGEVLDVLDEYFVAKKGDEIAIYNFDYEKIDSLNGSTIDYQKGYVVVDYGIYKVEKRS